MTTAAEAVTKIESGTPLREWHFDNLVRDLLSDVQCHCVELNMDYPYDLCAPCQIKTELCLRGYNELVDQIEESEGYVDPWDTPTVPDDDEPSTDIVAASFDPAYGFSPDEWGLMA